MCVCQLDYRLLSLWHLPNESSLNIYYGDGCVVPNIGFSHLFQARKFQHIKHTTYILSIPSYPSVSFAFEIKNNIFDVQLVFENSIRHI